MKKHKNRLLFAGLIVLCILSFTNVLSQSALSYLSEVYERSVKVLGIAVELKVAAGAGSSIGVPVLSGSFESTSDMMDQGIDYLEKINVLLLGQILLLSLSQSWVLKALVLLALTALAFTYKKSRLALHLLLVFLLLNPGLPIYVNIVKVIAHQSQVKLGEDLHADLSQVHNEFKDHQKASNAKLDSLKSKQLEKAKANGEDHLNWLTKAEDWVIGATSYVENELSLAYHETLTILKKGSGILLEKSVNFFVNSLFMFLILPLGYFALLRKLVPELISFEDEETLDELFVSSDEKNQNITQTQSYEKVES